jgi:hypothetical protein
VVAVAVVGCGGSNKNSPDAQRSDAPTDTARDAPPDGTPHGMVTVHVIDPAGSGADVIGATVVFLNPDGSLVANMLTDSSGLASADVLLGASVTAAPTVGPNVYRLTTLFDVKPGDMLTIGSVNPDSTVVGTFTVNFTTTSSAASYSLYGPCGSVFTTTSPATLTIYKYCQVATMELLLAAYDGTGAFVGYVDKPNVTYSDGGSAVLSPTYVAPATITATYNNVPSDVARLTLTRDAPATSSSFNASASVSPPINPQMVQVMGPVASSAELSTQYANATSSIQLASEMVAGNATTFTHDVGTTLLSWIGTPTFDIASETMMVPLTTANTSGDAPDMFAVAMSFTRGTNNVTWVLYGPTPGNITLPALPASLGLVPQTGDVVFNPFAAMFESDAVSGWDAVRAHAGTDPFLVGGVMATSAKLRSSTSPNPGGG